MWIRPLAEADASCGAKARGLARLIAAGLPVPDGFVLPGLAFQAVVRQIAGVEHLGPDAIGHALAEAGERIAHAALPAELEHAVRAAAAALGRVAVRSSAALEDGPQGSAAGVFLSVTDVAPEDVWDAVRAVWASALTPLAVAYARRRDAASTMAVIVQRFVPGARMTVYTRPVGASPGGPAQDLWLSQDGRIEHVPRSAAGARPEAALALAAEVAIDAASTSGADVELVLEPTPSGTRPWIVQARPIVAPAGRRRLAPPPIIVAALVQDGRRWTWDIAHNPDPLSPAQAGLVERVERAACSPTALRVCGGYLYMTPRAPLQLPVAPADRAELATRIAAIEARFELEEAPTVAAAVERYVAFIGIWARELSPLVAAARAKLLERLARDGLPPERIAARAASLIGPRRVLRDPVMSPAWDVAVPTFAEREADAPRARSSGPPIGPSIGSPIGSPLEPPPELAAEVELARAAADAAEHDDLWFARAQWLVRRALLACGAAWKLRGDDIFWLPLDEVVTLRIPDPDDAHRRASAARAAHARAAEWDMPRIVHGTEVSAEPVRAPADLILRGVGVGPRVVGRVVRLTAFGAAPPIGRGDVVVARAITPALAMIVDGCAALVSETGGLLDHGAALARELGVTCVVGCTGAWLQLIEGAMVSVDGDAGLVEPAELAELAELQ
jgi:phosphohistidine swiveling domain-containing protein